MNLPSRFYVDPTPIPPPAISPHTYAEARVQRASAWAVDIAAAVTDSGAWGLLVVRSDGERRLSGVAAYPGIADTVMDATSVHLVHPDMSARVLNLTDARTPGHVSGTAVIHPGQVTAIVGTTPA